MPTKTQANELLLDAQLVIDFASRAGLLEQPNDPLIGEVHKVRKQLAADPNGAADPHLGDLYVALSKAVKTIAPYISLRELQEGYSPFDKPKWRQKAGVVILLVLFGISLLLTILLILRLQNNLTQLNEINSVIKIDLDSQIKVVVRRIHDGSFKKTASEGFSSYMEALDKAKKATTQVRYINHISGEQDQGLVYNYFVCFFLPPASNKQDGTLFAGGPSSSGTMTQPPASKESSNWSLSKILGVTINAEKPNAEKPNAEKLPYDVNAYAMWTAAKPNTCVDEQKGLSSSTGVQAAKKGEELTACIISSLGFLNDIEKQTLVTITRRRTMEVYVLAAWLLPLVAGMLGSSVYLIHSYYFDKNMPSGSSTRVIIRFILGGIAGVIIGWVYAPARYSGNELEVVDAVRQFPFMFAFLAGFSSEYAFSFMARLISTTSNQPATKSNVVLGSPKP